MKDDNNNYFKTKMLKFNQSSFRLTDVTDLSQGEHPDILMDLLPLYDSDFFIESAVASILNAILTHKRAVFLKSTSDIKELINSDPNRKKERKDLSSKERNRIVAALKDQFIFEIEPGTSAPNIPAVWKVTDRRMIDFFCQELGLSEAELIEKQKIPILEWRSDVEQRFLGEDKRKPDSSPEDPTPTPTSEKRGFRREKKR